MILTLTPNPALDITYTVGDAAVHAEHRVRTVGTAAGGKGVNVARVVAALGTDVTVTGPLGGTAGEEIAHRLSPLARVSQAWTPIAGATRRTVTVIDPAGATGFNEPGPELSLDEAERLVADFRDLATRPGTEAVVISGSLPPGLLPGEIADPVEELAFRRIPVLVDTSGPALEECARAGASLLKPNAAEARAVTGRADPADACRDLLALGAKCVVCSLGPDGMIAAFTPGAAGAAAYDAGTGTADRTRPLPGTTQPDAGPGAGGSEAVEAGPRTPSTPQTTLLHARLDRPVEGNPTGAGDAAVASLALSLARSEDMETALRRAVALSASAVTQPVAGQVDPALADSLLPHITLTELT